MKICRREFIETVLALFHRQRNRTLWMQPRSQVWFEMVDEVYNDELWYANFRVTKGTFAFILGKLEQDIAHQNTRLRESVSAKQRLAVTLYYMLHLLRSTAQLATYLEFPGHLFANAFKKYAKQ